VSFRHPICIFLTLAIGAATASADIVYTTLGPNSPLYDSVGGWAVTTSGSVADAFAFQASSNTTVTRIDVALNHIFGDDSYIVRFHSDGGGSPGTVLNSWITGAAGLYPLSSDALVSLNLSTAITGGNTYWLSIAAAGPITTGAWNWNNQGISLNSASSSDAGISWTAQGSTTASGFQVIGSAVPEPSSFALMGIAIAGVAAARFRSKAKQLH
jgi:hypothetical protein